MSYATPITLGGVRNGEGWPLLNLHGNQETQAGVGAYWP